MEICNRTLSDEIKAALRLPAFDSYEWEDEDVLVLMQTMFIDTGLVEKFNIPLPTLREWLYEVYKHYNAVPFHNFRHCFCVAQMVSEKHSQTGLFMFFSSLFTTTFSFEFLCSLSCDFSSPNFPFIFMIWSSSYHFDFRYLLFLAQLQTKFTELFRKCNNRTVIHFCY